MKYKYENFGQICRDMGRWDFAILGFILGALIF